MISTGSVRRCRWLLRAAGAALLVLATGLATGGCAPTLGRYLEKIEPGTALAAKVDAVPPRSTLPPVPRNVVVVRFSDARTFGERNDVASGVGDVLAAVFTLGIAPILESGHPDRRDQPMSGLDTELPRRVAAWLAGTGAFASTTFVNHSAGALSQLRAGEGVPSNADVVVTAQVREFTGRWRVPPKPASGPTPPYPPLADCEGRIAVELQLLDAHTLRPLWSGPVAVAVAPADITFTLRDETRHTLENKLVVATLVPFAEQVEVALRAALSAPAGH